MRAPSRDSACAICDLNAGRLPYLSFSERDPHFIGGTHDHNLRHSQSQINGFGEGGGSRDSYQIDEASPSTSRRQDINMHRVGPLSSSSRGHELAFTYLEMGGNVSTYYTYKTGKTSPPFSELLYT